MKNVISLTLSSSLLLAACASKNNQNSIISNDTIEIETQQSQTVPEQNTETFSWNENAMVAITLLGYFDDINSFRSSARYAEVCKAFPEIKNFTNIAAQTLGDELYLIIPRDKQASVTVNEYSSDDFSNNKLSSDSQILYKSDEGNPFLIRCNNTNTYGNTLITIVDNDGKILEYSPRLSQNDCDYCLVTPYEGTVMDLKIPFCKTTPFTDSDTFISIGLSADIFNGRARILTDLKKLSENEIISEDDFRLFNGISISNVENQNSICIGVCIANANTNMSPTLCMLMDNNKIKIIDLINAMYTGDLSCSDFLPNIENVESFKLATDGDQNEIYAVTSDNKEIKIELYDNNTNWGFTTEKINLNIKLSRDWKIFTTLSDNEGSIIEVNSGYFYPTDNQSIYKYRFNRQSKNTDGAMVEYEVDIKGEFSITNTTLTFDEKELMVCD